MKSKLKSTGITQLNYCPNIDGESIKLQTMNKVDIAIMRIREFVKTDARLAFSGGKDSILTDDLCKKAGIPYKPYYSSTGIDPPELVYFIREHYPNMEIKHPTMSIFKALGTTNGFPTRQNRWCCGLLKEQVRGGIIITGIRWQESPGKRGNRRMFEACTKDKVTYFLNPIIDWTHKEVWEYIHSNNIPYCSLYDEVGEDGKLLFKRLGCVLCPMGTAKQAQIQIKRFPKLTEAWHRAFYRFYDLGWDSVKRWNNAEEMWQWWLSRKGEPKVNEAQCIMFDN